MKSTYLLKLSLLIISALSLSCSETLTSSREHSDYDNHRSAGDSANDYLSDSKFTKAIIEIQAVEGYEPTAETLAHLQSFAEARFNKTSVEIIVDPAIPSPGKTSYSLEDVRKIENDNRLYFTTGTTIYAYFLFLDGGSSTDDGDRKTLGYAHQNTSIAIFQKTITSLSGELLQPTTTVLETTVIEHELAHLMGLVNIGSDIQSSHHDSDHGAHCTNTSCLMHYTVDTSDVVANLVGSNVPELDADCIEDLQANGGK